MTKPAAAKKAKPETKPAAAKKGLPPKNVTLQKGEYDTSMYNEPKPQKNAITLSGNIEYKPLADIKAEKIFKQKYIAFKPTDAGLKLWHEQKECFKPITSRATIEQYKKAIDTNKGCIVASPDEFINIILKRSWIDNNGNYEHFEQPIYVH